MGFDRDTLENSTFTFHVFLTIRTQISEKEKENTIRCIRGIGREMTETEKKDRQKETYRRKSM